MPRAMSSAASRSDIPWQLTPFGALLMQGFKATTLRLLAGRGELVAATGADRRRRRRRQTVWTALDICSFVHVSVVVVWTVDEGRLSRWYSEQWWQRPHPQW
jgi:hypothetical protein